MLLGLLGKIRCLRPFFLSMASYRLLGNLGRNCARMWGREQLLCSLHVTHHHLHKGNFLSAAGGLCYAHSLAQPLLLPCSGLCHRGGFADHGSFSLWAKAP